MNPFFSVNTDRSASQDAPAGNAGCDEPVHALHVLRGPRPYDLAVHMYEQRAAAAPYALVLVHGTAGHGGCYDRFAKVAWRLGAHVYAFDLEGHGLSGGPRGRFTMANFLADVDAVTNFVRDRTHLPVVLLGSSQGGEVAFHALERCSAAAGAICMNVLLSAECPMNLGIRFMRSPLARGIDALFGDRLRVPLERVIDFDVAYREDPGLLAEKKRDPLYIWDYGFRSYRSVFAYDPPTPARANRKPVLIACGEDDPIVSSKHCLRCFERIGGPKDMYIMRGAGHQLMHFHTRRFARAIDSWVRHKIIERDEKPWTPPEEPPYDGYIRFLDEERRASGDAPFRRPTSFHGRSSLGEPFLCRDTTGIEYRLSWFDRALVAVQNGRVASGVQFFRNQREAEFGRFVSDVVAQIDQAAWPVFAQHLPVGPVPPRIAVLACGDGNGIAKLSSIDKRFARAEIVGIDVDGDAIEGAREKFRNHANISFIAGDARREGTLPDASFDVIYAHGIFDHCTNHRAVLARAFRALRPGGALFYILPDRNVATWLGFVSFGPRVIFRLKGYSDIHDYRRFARPAEFDSLLESVGFEPTPDPLDPRRALHRGVEYRQSPPRIWLGVRQRDLSALTFHLSRPRWWLGDGYRGEYLGVARKLKGGDE